MRAPKTIATASGHPAFGTYEGESPDTDLGQLSGAYAVSAPWRLLKEKRWQFALVATPEVIAVATIADLSYAASAFVAAVDAGSRRVLVDRGFLSLPGPFAHVGTRAAEGQRARLVSPLGGALSIRRPKGHERYQIGVDVWDAPWPRLAVHWRGEVLAAGGPPALTVISPVGQDGIVNVTQKWAGLLAFGSLSAAGRRYALDGGVAGLDYSHGYLARHTAWRWSMAVGRLDDGTPVGVNLVEGFNEESDEGNENAMWIGQRLFSLPRARFHFNKQDCLDPWRIHTADGSVELEMRPLYVHRDERDLKVVWSRFAQALGTFEGTLRADGKELKVRLSGVCEDQNMVW